MTGKLAGGRVRWRTTAPGARVAPVLVAALGVGFAAACHGAAAEVPALPVVLEGVAMFGTERYCTGYDTTFHGVWEAGEAGKAEATGVGGAPPVLFRIGLDVGGAGCYAQLNVRTPPGVAPYELPRFRARAGPGGGAWTLRYRAFVLEIDVGSGRVVRREGRNVVRSGLLLPGPPPVGEPLPPPSAERRSRWYATWRGRFPGVPFRVTLRFNESFAGEVVGRISMLLMSQTFTGRFHGDMLVFRWKNRHVGLVMEPDGDTLVYNDYRGRAARLRRVR